MKNEHRAAMAEKFFSSVRRENKDFTGGHTSEFARWLFLIKKTDDVHDGGCILSDPQIDAGRFTSYGFTSEYVIISKANYELNYPIMTGIGMRNTRIDPLEDCRLSIGLIDCGRLMDLKKAFLKCNDGHLFVVDEIIIPEKTS